jgi:hypothetical protein
MNGLQGSHGRLKEVKRVLHVRNRPLQANETALHRMIRALREPHPSLFIPTDPFAAHAISFAPDAASFSPDTASFAPDTASFAPDTASFSPDAISFSPDAISFVPDAISFAPDATSFAPRATSFAPDHDASVLQLPHLQERVPGRLNTCLGAPIGYL